MSISSVADSGQSFAVAFCPQLFSQAFLSEDAVTLLTSRWRGRLYLGNEMRVIETELSREGRGTEGWAERRPQRDMAVEDEEWEQRKGLRLVRHIP